MLTLRLRTVLPRASADVHRHCRPARRCRRDCRSRWLVRRTASRWPVCRARAELAHPDVVWEYPVADERERVVLARHAGGTVRDGRPVARWPRDVAVERRLGDRRILVQRLPEHLRLRRHTLTRLPDRTRVGATSTCRQVGCGRATKPTRITRCDSVSGRSAMASRSVSPGGPLRHCITANATRLSVGPLSISA